LLLAAELAEGIDSKAVAADLLSRGLIVNAVSPTALRFAPPLIVSESEILQAVDLLAAVLATHLTKAKS
jgi:acetylornithine/N-succinyldiaminopimelate aminotransferase